MEEIRTAFVLSAANLGWLGGINYYRNLLNNVQEFPEYRISPVLFVAPDMDQKLLDGYPDIPMEITNSLDLRKYRIDVISHIPQPVWMDGIATIAWIPDFQHKRMPQFFSRQEILNRDIQFLRFAEMTDCVILSSEDAQKDFETFYPEYKNKGVVLHFVSNPQRIEYDRKKLQAKYHLPPRFFYVPNQFWMHKNHKIVLDALRLLPDREIRVYCSGSTSDYRNNGYMDWLLSCIQEYGLEEQCIILGVVPYEDVYGLTKECTALLQPSLFEGWSTVVEEAKSLGKRILLSNIPVHREQNPEGGVFFREDSPESLADKMLLVWEMGPSADSQLLKHAEKQIRYRKQEMLEQYRKILEMAVARARN